MQNYSRGLFAAIFASLLLSGCGGVRSDSDPPARSIIKHLIIVSMQNNSFDHLFGTYPNANGLTPNVSGYTQIDSAGKTVQPFLLANTNTLDLNHTRTSYQTAYDSGKMDKYAWGNGDISMGYYDDTTVGAADDGRPFGVATLRTYAQQYALADNFFASAMASEPSNMLYMVAADVGPDPYGYPQLDACSAALYQQNKNAGATITPPLTFQNVGDQLSAANVSWGFYQEYFANQQNGTCAHYVPQENPLQYFQSTANGPNVQDFTMSFFQGLISSGNLPSVMWIQPSPVHSMRPGAGNIANGIEWLDELVQTVKSSPEWASSAIIVLWDESGGWYDHVAPPQLSGTIGLGARVPVLLISPFAKTNYISHQQMDFVSILRFIQSNWNLGSFSSPSQAAREQQSSGICDLFSTGCTMP